VGVAVVVPVLVDFIGAPVAKLAVFSYIASGSSTKLLFGVEY